MNYMNDYDIMLAQQRANTPVLRKAVQFLAAFKEQVNDHSDGWAYWKCPVNAANKLMELIQGKVEPTEANFKKAMSPIKSFMTRRGNAAGMQMPIIF
jgi:hypothetical protein